MKSYRTEKKIDTNLASVGSNSYKLNYTCNICKKIRYIGIFKTKPRYHYFLLKFKKSLENAHRTNAKDEHYSKT